MINFDEFDIDETQSIEYKIVNHIYKMKHNDEYSYNGYRYCLYANDSVYLGHGKWYKLLMYDIRPYKVETENEKDLIRKDKILITNLFSSGSNRFIGWVLSGLIFELNEFDPQFINHIDIK